jgi:hypothetical protein
MLTSPARPFVMRATAVVAALTMSMIGLAALAPADAAHVASSHAHAPAAWSGWSEVPGAGATGDAPEAVNFRGDHYLFVRGTDDRIYLNRFSNGGWSGWSEVPGGGLTLSAPAAVSFRHALRLYVRGVDDRIYVNKLSQ